MITLQPEFLEKVSDTKLSKNPLCCLKKIQSNSYLIAPIWGSYCRKMFALRKNVINSHKFSRLVAFSVRYTFVATPPEKEVMNFFSLHFFLLNKPGDCFSSSGITGWGCVALTIWAFVEVSVHVCVWIFWHYHVNERLSVCGGPKRPWIKNIWTGESMGDHLDNSCVYLCVCVCVLIYVCVWARGN